MDDVTALRDALVRLLDTTERIHGAAQSGNTGHDLRCNRDDCYVIDEMEVARTAIAAVEARAIEGSGVVEAAAAFIQRWDDRTHTDAADMVGHCWESIGALRNALAALHRPVASPDPTSNESTGGVASPEEPRVERCTWCGTPIAEHPLTDACAIAQESEAR